MLTTKKFQVFICLLSIVFSFALNFTMFSQNQIFILDNFRSVVTDVISEEYVVEDGIYSFDSTDFNYTENINMELKNGLVFGDDEVKLYINNVSTTYSRDDKSLSDTYEDIIVYHFSIYLSPVILLLILFLSIMRVLLYYTVAYIIFKVIEHFSRRNDHTNIRYSFKQYIKILNISVFISMIISSYAALLTGNPIGIVYMVILLLIATLVTYKYKNKI